jgi:hypothetical protein
LKKLTGKITGFIMEWQRQPVFLGKKTFADKQQGQEGETDR